MHFYIILWVLALDFDNIQTLPTLNESYSSKNESDEFFEACQNNMTKFVNNMQNNAKNQIRSSAQNSSSCKKNEGRNECGNIAMSRGNKFEGKFVRKEK